ncbi:hypothetical protein EVAR_97521_1 [Eumeta japonica]|uniref:Uncharacterized protein n=1 Tax=Eumeta variegata TaxID=151549 RepID=A0A4C1WLA7_EUMVA|nr:hypothetical protein EVAR_97521_1 [Eumeta japonica]
MTPWAEAGSGTNGVRSDCSPRAAEGVTSERPRRYRAAALRHLILISQRGDKFRGDGYEVTLSARVTRPRHAPRPRL